MAALTDLSDFVNRSTGGSSGAPENLWFYKVGRVAGAAPTAPVAGRPHSLWLFDGLPSGGITPTTVAAPTRTLAGALAQTNPAVGTQKWLTGFTANGLVAGTVILYDRLLHIGGLSGTTTTAQTVGGTLTRYTGGAGNWVWAEIYTAVGSTATTITMSYTNQAGTAGRTSQAVAFGGTGFNTQGRVINMSLAAGDTGVQAVASTTVLASTATAGNFGITVGHPLAFAVVDAAGTSGFRDFTTGAPGIPEVLTDACLALMWYPNTTTVPEVFGGASFVEK